MRIAVFGTDATHGGASRAMRRLIAGLSRRGHAVDLVCLTPDPRMAGCLAVRRRVKSDPENAMDDAALRLFNERYVRERRTAVSNTLFAPQLIGYALADSGLLEAYDAFNIHWVSHFLSIHGIAQIAALGKPVALTLHDMNFFTGGCHYSAGCRGYAADCRDCPQLRDDPLDLPAAVLRWKRRLYAEPNVTAVAPTRWLGGCAAVSGVFREGGVTVIPNSIETDVFVPGAKDAAKAAIGLDPGVKTLLFGAYNNDEHRKGFDHLAEVLRHMRADARIEALRGSGGIRVLAFGRSTPDLAASDYPIHDLGLIDDDIRLATAYSAADVFVLPSREDNQPNVMLEAMACGTPPVAFGVGGIPDTITDGVNGRMIQGFDTAAMAGAVTELLFDPARAAAMARAARETIEESYPLDLQAARYEALLRAMGAKTAAATERVRRGVAGGAASHGRDGSRFVEAPLSVPVDLEDRRVRVCTEPAGQARYRRGRAATPPGRGAPARTRAGGVVGQARRDIVRADPFHLLEGYASATGPARTRYAGVPARRRQARVGSTEAGRGHDAPALDLLGDDGTGAAASPCRGPTVAAAQAWPGVMTRLPPTLLTIWAPTVRTQARRTARSPRGRRRHRPRRHSDRSVRGHELNTA